MRPTTAQKSKVKIPGASSGVLDPQGINKPTQSKAQLVHFEFTAAEARSVSIAGTFNDWHPGVSPMIPLGNGRWVKKLTLLPGNYEYCLVVDDEWRPDPRAGDTITNPFGGLNSVLKVAVPAFPKPPAKDRQLLTLSI